MITLNEVTQRQDNANFNTYKRCDWAGTFDAMTDEEKAGLKERLDRLENIEENGDFDALCVKADGFSDSEYEEFSGMDLADELIILRGFFN